MLSGDAIRLGLVVAAAAALAGGGYWQGGRVVQGRWDAAELQREREQAEAAAEQRRLADRAARGFEVARARLAEAAPAARAAVGAGLRAPVACSAGAASVALGDLRVPAAVVDGLRRASGSASAP